MTIPIASLGGSLGGRRVLSVDLEVHLVDAEFPEAQQRQQLKAERKQRLTDFAQSLELPLEDGR